MKWFAACTLAALSLFGSENDFSEVSKIYIPPSNIAVTDTGIFIYNEGKWEPVDALFSDELGVYACDTRSYWECTRCGKCVSIVRNYCHSCLKPRYANACR